MAHPYSDHHERKVGHQRAKKMMRAAGGEAHADEAQDKALIRRMMRHSSESKVPGRKSSSRYARGGKVKGDVNITIVPPSGPGALPGPATAGALAPALSALAAGAARPPLPPPGPGGPMAPPPPMGAGVPPMPPRPPGMKRGGAIAGEMPENEGAWKEYASRNSSKPNRASGGRIKMTAGAESGVGRLQ